MCKRRAAVFDIDQQMTSPGKMTCHSYGMNPDQIAGDQAVPVGLKVRILDAGIADESDYAVVSGSRRALRFVAALLHSLADSPSLPADFSLGPKGAGRFHFDPTASLGLHLECTPEEANSQTVDSGREAVWVFHGDSSGHASAILRTESDARS